MYPRILTAIYQNNPKLDKRCHADKIPPEQFPIYLSLTTHQKETSAIQSVKAAIAHHSKDTLRIRTSKNLYCSSIEFRCYFTCPADLQTFSTRVLHSQNNLLKFTPNYETPYTVLTLAEEAAGVYQCLNHANAPTLSPRRSR